MNDFETLVQALDQQYEQYRAMGLRAIEMLQTADPEVANLLACLHDTPEQAAAWLVDRIPVLGGRRPVELLVQGQREAVLSSLRAQIAGCA